MVLLSNQYSTTLTEKKIQAKSEIFKFTFLYKITEKISVSMITHISCKIADSIFQLKLENFTHDHRKQIQIHKTTLCPFNIRSTIQVDSVFRGKLFRV